MKTDIPIDYQAALDAFRKEKHAPDNAILSIGDPSFPPMINGYVDYQAMIKKWDKEQEDKYIICLRTDKRNPSHDPIYRGATHVPAI